MGVCDSSEKISSMSTQDEYSSKKPKDKFQEKKIYLEKNNNSTLIINFYF